MEVFAVKKVELCSTIAALRNEPEDIQIQPDKLTDLLIDKSVNQNACFAFIKSEDVCQIFAVKNDIFELCIKLQKHTLYNSFATVTNAKKM